MRTWLITGVSRGLGLAIARCVLAAGDRVIGTVRSGVPDIAAAPDRFHAITCDLDDNAQVDLMVQQAFAHFGAIDVIVNNAGFGIIGAVDQTTDAELHQLFEVDVFAPIRIVQQSLPKLRANNGGHIVNITSIAGRAPGPGATIYAAAKYAMEGFSAALAQEVAQYGIRVTAVAPGQFRTGFLDMAQKRRQKPEATDSSSPLDAAVRRLQELSGNQSGDPEKAAKAILEIVESPEPPLHLLLGSDAIERYKCKAGAMAEEASVWERLTRSTDFGF